MSDWREKCARPLPYGEVIDSLSQQLDFEKREHIEMQKYILQLERAVAVTEKERDRLEYLVNKTYYMDDAGCLHQVPMDNLLADVAKDILEGMK